MRQRGIRARDLPHPSRLEKAVALYRGDFLEGFSIDDSPAFEDWALAVRERLEEQALQALQSLAAYHRRRGEYARAREYSRVQLPGALGYLAEAQAKAGQPREALARLAEALDLVTETDEHHWKAELDRLRGELLLTRDDQGGAEVSLHKAIRLARSQQAKSWELRSTVSLTRLWQTQDKQEGARQLLARIYGWFTEGFDTADLRGARSLLEEL